MTTPSRLAAVDVVKGMAMFDELRVPVAALVENMAYFDAACSTGATERFYPFGRARAAGIAAARGLDADRDVFALPMAAAVNDAADEGVPAVLTVPDVAAPFDALADALARRYLVPDGVDAAAGAERPAETAPTVLYRRGRGIVLRYLAGPREGSELVVARFPASLAPPPVFRSRRRRTRRRSGARAATRSRSTRSRASSSSTPRTSPTTSRRSTWPSRATTASPSSGATATRPASTPTTRWRPSPSATTKLKIGLKIGLKWQKAPKIAASLLLEDAASRSPPRPPHRFFKASVPAAVMAEEKAKADALFRERKFVDAVDAYDAAIAADPENKALYGNRAACREKLVAGSFGDEKTALIAAGLVDGRRCVALDAGWARGHQRLAAFCALAVENERTQASKSFLRRFFQS